MWGKPPCLGPLPLDHWGPGRRTPKDHGASRISPAQRPASNRPDSCRGSTTNLPCRPLPWQALARSGRHSFRSPTLLQSICRAICPECPAVASSTLDRLSRLGLCNPPAQFSGDRVWRRTAIPEHFSSGFFCDLDDPEDLGLSVKRSNGLRHPYTPLHRSPRGHAHSGDGSPRASIHHHQSLLASYLQHDPT